MARQAGLVDSRNATIVSGGEGGATRAAALAANLFAAGALSGGVLTKYAGGAGGVGLRRDDIDGCVWDFRDDRVHGGKHGGGGMGSDDDTAEHGVLLERNTG